MKKILFCSEFFYPNIGGVELHNKILSEYFKRKKFDVYIATSYDLRRKKSNNVFQFKIKGNIVKGFSGETLNYQNFLIKKKFDIIFFNAAQQWSFDLALPILKNIKSKKIFFPCGFSRINNILFKPYFKLIKSNINEFDEIICTYKNLEDYKFIKKYYKRKIHLINNGSLKYSQNINIKLSKLYNLSKNCNIFVNVSNFKFFKGQDRTINLFKKLQISNAVLFLMGEKISIWFYYFLKIQVIFFNYFNKSKKIFILQNNHKLKKLLLSESKFFLFGSRLEYDPIVMYEALISDTRFISYDVGSCKSVINNEKKGLVSENDNKKIRYIMKYLNIPTKNNAKKYLWSEICKKYYKVFTS